MKWFTRILIYNARPYTLFMSCGSVMFGIAAAVFRGGVSLFPALLTLLFALLLQISVNLNYGYIDACRILKDNVGFRTLVQEFPQANSSNVVLISSISKVFAILAATVSLPLFTFIGWIGVLYVAVILIILYFDFHGSHPLARTPWSIFITFIIFGPVTVCGTALIQDFDNTQLQPLIVYSFISGFMACNAHIAIQYIRLQEDMGRGKCTLLIKYGFKKIRYLYMVNAAIVSTILMFRPCMENFVGAWVPVLLGVILMGSSLLACKYMDTHSRRYNRKLMRITQVQYIFFILLILLIVIYKYEGYKLNIMHLV